MAIYDPALLDAIEQLPAPDWRGRAWRHMFNDYPPERSNTSGARWNPPGVEAIYTALDRDTAVAEGQHAIDVQPRRIFRRRVLYELEIDVMGVVDLTTTEALTSVGLTLANIADDSHAACQQVGGAIAWLHRGGILVPSARNDGTNLVILLGAGDPEIERVSQQVLFEAENT